MKTIRQFTLTPPTNPEGRVRIKMPAGSRLLTVQVLDDALCLWAVCDNSAPVVERSVFVCPTYDPLPEGVGPFLGTAQLDDGSIIVHFFGDHDETLWPAPGAITE